MAVALWSGQAEGLFLPGIVTSALLGVACVASILVRRPLIALTSAMIHRWPLGWYWQDGVRPAYSEVTWAWAVLYLAKAAVPALLAFPGGITVDGDGVRRRHRQPPDRRWIWLTAPPRPGLVLE